MAADHFGDVSIIMPEEREVPKDSFIGLMLNRPAQDSIFHCPSRRFGLCFPCTMGATQEIEQQSDSKEINHRASR